MGKIRAGIVGVSGYVPEDRLTNADLEKIVDTNDEWIRTRTGIEERRILRGEGKGVSEMCIPAVLDLLKKTNTSPEEIDVVICATVTGDYVFPDTANIVRDAVGIKKGFGFDLNAACSGFLFALTTGAQFIESGRNKKVIVIGADKMTSIVDYTDRTTCILFGDAAGAVLLEAVEDDHGIIDSTLHADGSGKEFLMMKAGGSAFPATQETLDRREHFAFQDGRTVFKHAVNGMKGAVGEIMQRNELSMDNLDWMVPHQANLRIISTIANFAEIPMEKVMINIQKYGNTTSATIPLCLWEYEQRLKKGDNLILTAFGGGFTWGATYIKWSYDPK